MKSNKDQIEMEYEKLDDRALLDVRFSTSWM